MSSTEEVVELKQKIAKMEKYIAELEASLKKYNNTDTNDNIYLKFDEKNKHPEKFKCCKSDDPLKRKVNHFNLYC